MFPGGQVSWKLRDFATPSCWRLGRLHGALKNNRETAPPMLGRGTTTGLGALLACLLLLTPGLGPSAARRGLLARGDKICDLGMALHSFCGSHGKRVDSEVVDRVEPPARPPSVPDTSEEGRRAEVDLRELELVAEELTEGLEETEATLSDARLIQAQAGRILTDVQSDTEVDNSEGGVDGESLKRAILLVADEVAEAMEDAVPFATISAFAPPLGIYDDIDERMRRYHHLLPVSGYGSLSRRHKRQVNNFINRCCNAGCSTQEFQSMFCRR